MVNYWPLAGEPIAEVAMMPGECWMIVEQAVVVTWEPGVIIRVPVPAVDACTRLCVPATIV